MKSEIKQKVVVSVLMTSYNQAKYIKDAIEGVLMQQTNFNIELLIGEDAGNKDNSLEICREYEKKYPEIIRVIYDGKNHGMVANEQRLIDLAKGKYIAFCEADDYWIDPLKLQKQVDILESNPKISACASQSRIIYGTDKLNYHLLNQKLSNNQEITFIDLIEGNGGFQTASFIFRAKNIKNLPPIPNKINGWDRAVFLLNAYYGNIYWFKDEMAVYRKNDDGISSWVTYDLMRRDLDMIKWFKAIDKKFPINELKSHLYYAIMLNSIKLSVLNLFHCYVLCVFFAQKSKSELPQLKMHAKENFMYRLPKTLRRIMKFTKLI